MFFLKPIASSYLLFFEIVVESNCYPKRMEGQTADGPDPLSHEAVVVLDVADHVPVGVVDGDELVHGAAGHVMRKSGEENGV